MSPVTTVTPPPPFCSPHSECTMSINRIFIPSLPETHHVWFISQKELSGHMALFKRSSLAGRNHLRKYLLHSLAVRGVDMTSGCQLCLSPLLPPHNQKGARTHLKQLLCLFSSSLNTAKIAISQEVSLSNLFCCKRR